MCRGNEDESADNFLFEVMELYNEGRKHALAWDKDDGWDTDYLMEGQTHVGAGGTTLSESAQSLYLKNSSTLLRCAECLSAGT